MTHMQAQNELRYRMIESCLKRLEKRGLLTEQEYEIANGHNVRRHMPKSRQYSL